MPVSKDTHNSDGQEYAKYSDLKEGDMIHMDGRFKDCGIHNKDLRVLSDGKELYVPCSQGKHFISANITTEQGHLIGITRAEETTHVG